MRPRPLSDSAPGEPSPRFRSRESLARPGALRRAVAELEAILREDAIGGSGGPGGAGLAPRLGELASAPALASLFRLALVSAVRRGPATPEEGPSPARVLGAAAEAAASGHLAVPALVVLRASLDTLERELHERGAWDPAVPVWWRPLPAPGPLETSWDALEAGLSRALDPAAGRRGAGAWLRLPTALPPEVIPALQERLERVVGRGAVALSPGGVGPAGESSPHRSDAVAFLTGLEPPLLAEVPGLAVLVQWLLARGAGRLGRALVPERELFAPQTAMLSRYRAPASGFDPHLDNPGGANDNGREVTAILYLGAPDRPCAGGELELWPAGSWADGPSEARIPAVAGSAVVFDARRTLHAVRPLAAGPARWTLVVWLNETSRRPPDEVFDSPHLELRDALKGVDDPPVAPGRVIFRELDAEGSPPSVAVHALPGGPPPRVGMVATVEADAARGLALEGWIRHHLELGVDHLLVVVDEPSGPGETRALRRRVRAIAGGRATVWSAGEARRRWPPASSGAARGEAAELRRQADGGGPAAWAVAARQTLNASAALAAARGDELGGRPLDWLLHLDADELLVLEGAARGGATLADHFAAARAAGLAAIRYADHELLLPWERGAPLRFKVNPRLAAARLGRTGWEKVVALLGMAQAGPRPYFRAYWNGKSAVAVGAAEGAAGVHGWRAAGTAAGGLLAGPSVLHVHLPTAAAFRSKYLRLAGAPDAGRPFPPSLLEESARDLIRTLRAEDAPPEAVERRLDALYRESCVFAPHEIELLETAGLLVAPELGPGRLLAEVGPADARAAGAGSRGDTDGSAGPGHGT